jgi:hypothetical protein
MSGELGTHKTVKARFWPWLEPVFIRKFLNPDVVPFSLESG